MIAKGNGKRLAFDHRPWTDSLEIPVIFAHRFTPLLYDAPRVLINAYTLRESVRHLLRAVEGTGSALRTAYANEAIFFPCGSTPHELNSETAALSPLH